LTWQIGHEQVTKFVISEFTNPSGEVVFRVAGWLDGKRVRKKFDTHAEAEAERQVLELAALQSESGRRGAATRLVDDQLREAEAAFHGIPKEIQPEDRGRSRTFFQHRSEAFSRRRRQESRTVHRRVGPTSWDGGLELKAPPRRPKPRPQRAQSALVFPRLIVPL